MHARYAASDATRSQSISRRQARLCAHHQPLRGVMGDAALKAHLCLEPETGLVTAATLTSANHPDGPSGIEMMGTEPEGLEVLGDSAYGSAATRLELKTRRHRLVIKPVPFTPAVPGGFVRDEFTVDHAARVVTCPAGHVAGLSPGGVAKFAPHCQACPLQLRCT